MFISFVIPLYNCEKYILRCLDSIADAGLSDEEYEVIIVNDGSTDHGPELCSQYKRADVLLFHQRNSGQATARNLGLSKAKGDYVWFVDADDTIISRIVKQLYKEVESNSSWDMISFNYKMEYIDHIQIVSLIEDREIIEKGIDYLKRFRGGSYLWNKVFKRSSLTRLFLENTSHIEDMCFNVQNIIMFQKVLLINSFGYLYNRTNTTSTSHSHSKSATNKANDDAFRVYFSLHQDMVSTQDEGVRSYLSETLNFGVAGHIFTMLKESTYEEILYYIKKYKELGLYPVKKSFSKKANYFAFIANKKTTLFLVYKFKQLVHFFHFQ